MGDGWGEIMDQRESHELSDNQRWAARLFSIPRVFYHCMQDRGIHHADACMSVNRSVSLEHVLHRVLIAYMYVCPA